MKGFMRVALAKKQKYFMRKKKIEQEQEDNLSDVDEMEISENMLGKLYDGKYLTLKYLGSGTFSRVWLVYDIPNNQYYAMKMYYPQYQEDGEYEIRYLKKLRDMNNVVKLFDDFTCKVPIESNDPNNKYKDNPSVCLIVELMGKSLMKLYDIYEKGTPFDIFKQVAYNSLVSLNDIHMAGLIHTDIKLENLMLHQLTGEVKEVVKWFNDMKPHTLYDSVMQSLVPHNWKEFGKNKQKNLKREIKKKACKKITAQLSNIINNHVNEMGQYKIDLHNTQAHTDDADLPDPNEIELDDDIPELVNLEEIVQTENEVQEENTTETVDNLVNLVENKDIIHDDEIDLNLLNMTVKIGDFGNACPIDNIDDDDIQIRSYRPPEVVMGELYNEKVDVWSMACLFYELLTHEYLFEVDSEHDDNVEQDRLLLSQMYSTLGKIPYDYCIDTERTYELFDEKGRVKKYKKIDYNLLEDRLAKCRPDLSKEQLVYASSLIRNMMKYEVKSRSSARECLNHPIFTSIVNQSSS
jgi:serine/threonine protein kinase